MVRLWIFLLFFFEIEVMEFKVYNVMKTIKIKIKKKTKKSIRILQVT